MVFNTYNITGGSASLRLGYERFQDNFSHAFGLILMPSKIAFLCLFQVKNYTHQAIATLTVKVHHCFDFFSVFYTYIHILFSLYEKRKK